MVGLNVNVSAVNNNINQNCVVVRYKIWGLLCVSNLVKLKELSYVKPLNIILRPVMLEKVQIGVSYFLAL